jgi:hypothetical protein
MHTNEPVEHFNDCLTHSQHMFAARRFEASYEYLWAAYHLAIGTSDQQLYSVEQCAREQCSWLENHPPKTARFSPQLRQHWRLIHQFRTLKRLAKTQRLALQSELLHA